MTEPPGQFDGLPEVVPGLAGRLHLLEPLLAATLGIAVDPFLFHPTGGGEDHVGQFGGLGGVDVGDDDEPAVPLLGAGPVAVQLGHGLEGVRDLDPDDLQIPPVQGTEHLHGVERRLVRDLRHRHVPDLGRLFPVLRIGHHHVRREAVGKGPHLAGGAAGRGLAGEGHGVFAGSADLAGEEVDVVDQVVDPGAAGVLVEAHGPEGVDLAVPVAVEGRHLLDGLDRHAGELGDIFRGVRLEELLVLLEGHRLGIVHEELGLVLQAIADVFLPFLEDHVLLDEILVVFLVPDDDVGDAVQERQVGLGDELDIHVGHLGGAGPAGPEVDDLHLGILQPVVDEPGEEDRVHLGHVGPPEKVVSPRSRSS